MHGTITSTGSRRDPRTAVAALLDRFQAHDVDGMALLCSHNASFQYIPLEMRGNQRTQRAQGSVHGIGKAVWHGMIFSFPDLSLTVRTMTANDQGDVVAQVDVTGTQTHPWVFTKPTGQRFAEPHLFILHVGGDQLIDDITAYWNDASIVQQLGHTEVE